jgi:hypothetical protein
MGILEQVEAAMVGQKCRICGWNTLCVSPPAMTPEEVEEQIDRTMPEGPEDMVGSLMSALFFGGMDKKCAVCETFSSRLRASPKLSQEIKRLMVEWED